VTATTILRPEDLAIDRELADTAQSFRFLLDVTPTNGPDARRRFLEDGVDPHFAYRELEDDPAVIASRLQAVPVDSVEDHTLAHLLLAKQRELELQLEMLCCRGSDDFLTLSIELWGTVSPALLAEAESLLAAIEVPAPESEGWLDADAFAERAEAELEHYRSIDEDIEVHVSIRDDVAAVMVSGGELLVPTTARIPLERVDALLHHEIGTHLVTHVNGSHQPLRTLAAGLAGYDETQEGLAVLAEHLAGGLTPRRLRQLAARVVAVHQMVDDMPFADVHAHLVDAGLAPGEAFTIAMRVFRCGGLTKDAVYLRGLRDLVGHLASGFDLDILWLGKLPLTAAPLVEDLHDRGALVDPLLLPRYLHDGAAKARLEQVRQVTALTDLIGGPA
jgi:uncharacterized protein (TIGR02421 family)